MQSFRDRTGKFRGDTFEERVLSLIARWSKVINDCKSSKDDSKYRQEYREVHEEYLEGMGQLIGQDETFIRNHLRFKKAKAENKYFSSQIGSLSPEDSNGTLDAIGYIIAEIESILEQDME